MRRLLVPTNRLRILAPLYCLILLGAITNCSQKLEASKTSSVAPLDLPEDTRLAPTISIQPNNQSVDQWDTVSFSVVAEGTEPFYYQWYKDGESILGATSSEFSIPSSQPSDVGGYSVVVENSKGDLESETANLDVTPAPDCTLGGANILVDSSVGIIHRGDQIKIKYCFAKNGRYTPTVTDKIQMTNFSIDGGRRAGESYAVNLPAVSPGSMDAPYKGEVTLIIPQDTQSGALSFLMQCYTDSIFDNNSHCRVDLTTNGKEAKSEAYAVEPDNLAPLLYGEPDFSQTNLFIGAETIFYADATDDHTPKASLRLEIEDNSKISPGSLCHSSNTQVTWDGWDEVRHLHRIKVQISRSNTYCALKVWAVDELGARSAYQYLTFNGSPQ